MVLKLRLKNTNEITEPHSLFVRREPKERVKKSKDSYKISCSETMIVEVEIVNVEMEGDIRSF